MEKFEEGVDYSIASRLKDQTTTRVSWTGSIGSGDGKWINGKFIDVCPYVPFKVPDFSIDGDEELEDEQNIDHMIVNFTHGEAPLKQGIFYRCEYCRICNVKSDCYSCLADETTYRADYVWGHDCTSPHHILRINGEPCHGDKELADAIDELMFKLKKHIPLSPLAKDLKFALNTIIERHYLNTDQHYFAKLPKYNKNGSVDIDV